MKTRNFNSASKLALMAVSIGLATTSVVNAQTINSQPGVSAITPVTEQIETGPILDVVPYVLSDGYTINLALIPSDLEFGGYDTLVLPQVTGNLNVVQLPTVLPKFTVRQAVTTVNVWDGQTVVLGGLVTSTVQDTKNKVPVLGDLPMFGRFFQSQSKTTVKDNLMIFVTATIVDPAGNPIHSDDELPFAQNSFPVQPPGAGQMTESVNEVRGVNALPGANQ